MVECGHARANVENHHCLVTVSNGLSSQWQVVLLLRSVVGLMRTWPWSYTPGLFDFAVDANVATSTMVLLADTDAGGTAVTMLLLVRWQLCSTAQDTVAPRPGDGMMLLGEQEACHRLGTRLSSDRNPANDACRWTTSEFAIVILIDAVLADA